jgi:hypothetical protein
MVLFIKITEILIILLCALGLLIVLKLAMTTFVEGFSLLTQPYLVTGDKVTLQTRDGRYVTACNNCNSLQGDSNNKCSYVLCLRKNLYNTGIFTLHKHDDYKWSFETEFGRFWKRCENCIYNCDSAICADGVNDNLTTHKFYIIKNSDGSIKLKSDNGRFLESCPCKQTCGKDLICAKGLGGDIDFIITKTQESPPPKKRMDYVTGHSKVQWQNQSVPKGVLLSNVT